MMNLKDYLPTVGPGFTDYPENDIRTHRELAWVGRWMGNIGLVLFAYLGITEESVLLLAAGIVAYFVCQHMSMRLRLEALEWENELIEKG